MPMKPRYGNPPLPPGRVRPPRPSAVSRGYTYAWIKIAKQFRQEFPLCMQCGATASSVDHVVPLRAGGTHDLWNLQSLCQSCHQRKTRADQKRWPRREGGLDISTA